MWFLPALHTLPAIIQYQHKAMNRIIFLLIFLVGHNCLLAQPTFKAGWNTYQTAAIIHEYNYNYSNNDTSKLTPTDSVKILLSPDSLVTLTATFPTRDKSVYKKIHYFNEKKQVTRIEEYKDENLTLTKEWRYDDKNRKNYYYEDNKVKGNNFRKTYDYASDKKTGDIIVTEVSQYNGRVEFYTKSYYNKKSVKYKEVRLNDNNKDVVHIETFYYGENGKLKERSVYFPEWKVTKKFAEKEGNIPLACCKCLPVGTAEKITIAGRLSFIRRLLVRNMAFLSNSTCPDFEYTYKNFLNCEIIVSTTNNPAIMNVSFRFKEKNPR